MRDISDGMGRAWRTMLLSLALTFGGLLMTLLALGSVLSILLLFVTLAGLIVMIVADYYFYFALDELIFPRGYNYPSGRIRWCFWLSLIGRDCCHHCGNVFSFRVACSADYCGGGHRLAAVAVFAGGQGKRGML